MYKQPTMIHGVTGFKKMEDVEEIKIDSNKANHVILPVATHDKIIKITKWLDLPKPQKYEYKGPKVTPHPGLPGTITPMPNPYKSENFRAEFESVFVNNRTPIEMAGLHRGVIAKEVCPVLEMTKYPQSGGYWDTPNCPRPSTIDVDIKQPIISQLESADLGHWGGGERWASAEISWENDIKKMNKVVNESMTIPEHLLNASNSITGIAKPTERPISKVDMDVVGIDCGAPSNPSPITPKPQVTGNGGLGWPFPTSGSGISGSTGVAGSNNFGSSIGSLAGNVSYTNPIPALTTVQLTSMSITGGNTIAKDDIQYIVVLKDGHCIELVEQQTMTPREMLNIAKFISMVGQVLTVAPHTNIKVQWSDLIDNLGINNHFEDGFPDTKQYKLDMGIQYVFLYDAH